MNQVSVNKIQYFSSIEWLRFFAAFGIVWFHNENAEWRSIGYAGLPIFLIVFCFLIVAHYDEMKISEFLKKRATRLLIPWVFWSFVYTIVKFAKDVFVDKQLSNIFSINTIFIGGSTHLWFLPFSFLVALAFFAICRFAFVYKKEKNHTFLISFLLLIIITTFYLCDYIGRTYSVPIPLSQWLFALPSLPTGFLLGYIVRITKPDIRLPLLALVYATLFGACFSLYWLWDSNLLISYGIGAIFTIVAIQYPFPFEKAARQVSTLTYGIYLIHPLVSSGINMAFHISAQSLKIITIFTISLIIVYLLKRTVFRFVL